MCKRFACQSLSGRLTFCPCLPHTDLQRELNSNVPRAARTTEEENQRIQNKHVLPPEERSAPHTAVPTAPTSMPFLSQFKPPDSPVTSDVFQLAPFKTPVKEGKMASSSSSCSASRKQAEAPDVFLQAPFGKRQTKAVPSNAHMLRSGAQPVQPIRQCHLVPAASPPVRAPIVRMETPLLQQPVAVHRVVSRIGQQAAVGSVAVGPLHAWTIGGRALEDPFTAAPFQPRCSQGKP